MNSAKIDILVVGGGIAGTSALCAIAEMAKRLGVQQDRMLLVEAENELAYHTSSRSAQQVILTYGAAPIRELSEITVSSILADQSKCGHKFLWPSSFLMVGTTEELQENGFEGLELISKEKLQELAPSIRLNQFPAAGLERRSMRTNGVGLVHWYAERAVSAGAEVWTQTRVIKVERQEPGFLVTLDGVDGEQRIEVRTIVNAAGAWANQIAEFVGATSLDLVPLRRSAAVVSIIDPLEANHPLVVRADDAWYLRPDGDDVLISSCEAEPSHPEDAQPRIEQLEEVRERITSDTRLQLGHVKRAWTGLRTEAQDGVPVNGWDQSVTGFYWLAGQGGVGFQTCDAMARIAAELILDGRVGHWVSNTTVDALSPARFKLDSQLANPDRSEAVKDFASQVN